MIFSEPCYILLMDQVTKLNYRPSIKKKIFPSVTKDPILDGVF